MPVEEPNEELDEELLEELLEELELLLEVMPVRPEVLPIPKKPLELELLPVPKRPLELELLEALLLEELLLEVLLDELLDELVPEEPLDELLPEELEEDEPEELELLADACPVLPWPEVPPSNIAIASASCDGKLSPSTRSGTSVGLESANTNSFLPL